MLSHLKGKGVVKKVVKGCCYAERGSKRKTMLVLPAQENYDSCSWRGRTHGALIQKYCISELDKSEEEREWII